MGQADHGAGSRRPLPREVNVLVDPNAGASGVRCYCTCASYVVARTELK